MKIRSNHILIVSFICFSCGVDKPVQTDYSMFNVEETLNSNSTQYAIKDPEDHMILFNGNEFDDIYNLKNYDSKITPQEIYAYKVGPTTPYIYQYNIEKNQLINLEFAQGIKPEFWLATTWLEFENVLYFYNDASLYYIEDNLIKKSIIEGELPNDKFKMRNEIYEVEGFLILDTGNLSTLEQIETGRFKVIDTISNSFSKSYYQTVCYDSYVVMYGNNYRELFKITNEGRFDLLDDIFLRTDSWISNIYEKKNYLYIFYNDLSISGVEIGTNNYLTIQIDKQLNFSRFNRESTKNIYIKNDILLVVNDAYDDFENSHFIGAYIDHNKIIKIIEDDFTLPNGNIFDKFSDGSFDYLFEIIAKRINNQIGESTQMIINDDSKGVMYVMGPDSDEIKCTISYPKNSDQFEIISNNYIFQYSEESNQVRLFHIDNINNFNITVLDENPPWDKLFHPYLFNNNLYYTDESQENYRK